MKQMTTCVPPHKTIKYFLRRSALHLIMGLFIYCINITNVKAQNVGINFNGAAPNAAAAFDVDVSALAGPKKGLLIPRVTQTQLLSMDPLPDVATGLMIYKTDGFRPGFYYNSSITLIPIWNLLATDETIRWNGLQDPIAGNTINHGAFRTNFTFNGATELGAFNISSNSLTKSSLLDLNVLTTNGASGHSTTVLDMSKSGANINSNHKSYGISSRVSNTGTSSTNIAGFFSSTGGSINLALYVPQDGGKVSLGSLTTGINSILSINNGHFQAQQTTRPTIATTLNAGILSDGIVEQFSSDVAGTFSINSIANTNFGEQATITFNKSFTRPAIVVVTAANLSGATRSFWVDSFGGSFKIFFTSSPAQLTTYTYNYMVIAN
jgi:hypothetical protein